MAALVPFNESNRVDALGRRSSTSPRWKVAPHLQRLPNEGEHGRWPYGIMHVGIFPRSRHAFAGKVLTVPFEGFTHGQGFEPKNAGFTVR